MSEGRSGCDHPSSRLVRVTEATEGYSSLLCSDNAKWLSHHSTTDQSMNHPPRYRPIRYLISLTAFYTPVLQCWSSCMSFWTGVDQDAASMYATSSIYGNVFAEWNKHNDTWHMNLGHPLQLRTAIMSRLAFAMPLRDVRYIYLSNHYPAGL